MNKPTVYVAQKPDEKKNIFSANKYGEFKFILPEKTNLMWDTAAAVSTIKKELSNLNDREHLVLIVDTAVIGICTAVAADYNQGRVKFLKWDNREFTYYPVEVEI